MKFENVSFAYGTQAILNNVSFSINSGEKVGVVGQNGAGKTTLFNLIRGAEMQDNGSISVESKSGLGYLPQIIAESDDEKKMTVEQYILASRPIDILNSKLEEIYSNMKDLESDEINRSLKEASQIQTQLEFLDCYEYESILHKIISNMGISEDMLRKKMCELSGGQKSKVAFARLLYSKFDVLLLDEPTNHLDSDTKDFVIEWLKAYKGKLLVISHDVDFLNAVTNRTLFLDKRTSKVEKYNGNYSVFEKLHEEYETTLKSEAKRQEAELARLQAVVDKYRGVSGKRKKMAQDREKKIERLKSEQIVVEKDFKSVSFKMEQDGQSGKIPIRLTGVRFKYPDMDKVLLSNVSIEINRGEKVLVVGPNGTGKSTLLKIMLRQIRPDAGEVFVGSNTQIGYYAQEHENLNLNQTILQNVAFSGISSGKLRSILAHFLFFGEEVNKLVEVLSPGERARVSLAKLAVSGCNTLILDEPTNHLDPETQSIISEVFGQYNGTLIVVSHNPSFVNNLGFSRMLVLPEGKITSYDEKIVKKMYEINTKVLTLKPKSDKSNSTIKEIPIR